MAERGHLNKTTQNDSKFDSKIDFIIGSPPGNPQDDEGGGGPSKQTLINNAMPIVYIQPGTPNFTNGLDLMSRSPAMTTITGAHSRASLDRTDKAGSYVEQLSKLGFSLNQPSPGKPTHLTCAYLADNFPTDTFTNEYGENFLQKITNVASEGMAGLSQMFGGRSATETAQNIISSGSKNDGFIGTLFKGAQVGFDQIKELAGKLPDNAMLSRLANNVDVMAAGGRIDFPMLWKNSTYSPSYTMTVRLYNPNPNSKEVTNKFIVGPIAALLLLGLPQSVGTGAYSWPYIHQFYSPGIYNLDPGYISNITIVKGGDQQQISWKQRMGLVDVRIDFGSVFNSILSNASESRNRPTLKGYLSALSDEKDDVFGITDTQRVNNEQNQSPSVIPLTKNIGSNTGGLTNSEIKNYRTNRAGQRADQATTQEKTQLDITEPGEEIQARVTENIKEIADNLIDLIPVGVRISF
jgi:hypothetical protein